MPTQVFFFALILAEAGNFHAIIVKTIWLCKVYDIKTNFTALFSVTNSKEKPLSMSMSVNIIL